MSQAQIDLLAEVNAFNVEGRYPELQMPAPTKAQVQAYRQRIGELVEWLTSQLSKV